MTDRLHIHIPWHRIDEAMPFILDRGLQPEIAFKAADFEKLDRRDVERVSRQLRRAGLRVSIHAPFADLNPGALEPLVLAATEKRFQQTMDIAAALEARLVVFHPGYDHWKYGGLDHLWLQQNLDFWPPLIARAARIDCLMALENIFEQRPDTLVRLLDAFDSPWLGHCFDVGHWHLFSEVGLDEWFAALGRRTIHLHLHDNHGAGDDHLPVGSGSIDFPALFSLEHRLPGSPSMTLEIHTPEGLLSSVDRVAALLA